MKSTLFRFPRAIAFVLALTLFGLFALSAGSGLVRAQNDAPAADCNSGPNVVCPGAGDPGAQYIASVTAVPGGVVILLTDAGLSRARACGGAAEIAAMAATLYAAIPDAQKTEFRLDWGSTALLDEIYGHAFLNQLTEGLGLLSDLHERSNPINIVFADYGGPGEMTAEARAEQVTYAALGAVHRAAC